MWHQLEVKNVGGQALSNECCVVLLSFGSCEVFHPRQFSFTPKGFALEKQNVGFAFASFLRVVGSRVGRIPHFVNRNIRGVACFMFIQVMVLCGTCLGFVLHSFYIFSTSVLHAPLVDWS